MRTRLVLHVVSLSVLCGAVVAPVVQGRVASAFASAHAIERVRPNDNRRPAGTLRGTHLTLRLDARVATWHPDGESAPGASVPAFAEEGRPAEIPGPLVRVPAGTEAQVSVRNALHDTLLVYGLHDRTNAAAEPGTPLVLAPGERRSVRFRLEAPGTYYYWGTTTRRAINFRTLEDAQLTGALVVDDGAARSTRDRVFVMGMWTDTVHRAMTHRQRVLAVINGRSWPHTERLHHTEGDTVRWRVINASADLHPMHLHGFYFRVDSRGDARRDTVYAPGTGNMAVTESMAAGSTMRVTWVPERAGNWLFHCHIPEHFGPRGSLGLARPAAMAAGAHANHAKDGMNGLVLGIDVQRGRAAARAAARAGATARSRGAAGAGTGAGGVATERSMRLLVRPNRGSSNSVPFYGYAWHEGGAEPPADSGLGVGPTLDLQRGRPVRITVVNRLAEPTAVHWHGIELESYYDGVPGFSGAARRVTPLIAPGDSFVVRFTPPRAGTFIYHTHADEERQQLAGLAGVIIVSEPDARRDVATDLPILITAPTEFAQQGRLALVNGRAAPAPLSLQLGTTYRLRFVQMSVSRAALHVRVFRDSALTEWRPVAKDGAALPASVRGSGPARAQLGIGETLDVELTPATTGDMRLEVRVGPPWPAPSVLLATLPIRVLPARGGQHP
ncbi:MAG: multicopper oxidase domain-containing protein [Gemmatimonadota bacterium]